MNYINSKLKLGLMSVIIAGSSMYCANVHARFRHSFFFDDIWNEIDQMHNHMQKMRELHNELFNELQDVEPVKVSRPSLPAVDAQVSQDENNVIINLTIGEVKEGNVKVENLTEKDIDVSIEDGELLAVVSLANGKVELIVDRNSMELIKKAEIKKESKDEKGERKVMGYSSSSIIKSLPNTIEINKEKADLVKAEVKNNVITLTIPKKKQVKVPVVTNNVSAVAA